MIKRCWWSASTPESSLASSIAGGAESADGHPPNTAGFGRLPPGEHGGLRPIAGVTSAGEDAAARRLRPLGTPETARRSLDLRVVVSTRDSDR
jgi:hypothetical protein